MTKWFVLWILLCILSGISEVRPADPLNIEVFCDSAGMYVHVSFETPFEGMIYSKGYLNDSNCRYLPPQGIASGFTFHIPRSRCGTETSSLGSALNQTNTVVFQNNPMLETSMDHVHKLSCDSQTKYFTPETTVHNPEPSENSVRSWMEIKKFPDLLSGIEPVGNVKVGDEMMVVIYISKPRYTHSVRIVNCEAHDEQTKENATIVKLLDSSGCPLQPQIFSSFELIEKNLREFAIALSHMTAFKFREKENLYISCEINSCSDNCSTVCPKTKSMYEYQSSTSRNEFSKRLVSVPDASSTHSMVDTSDKRRKALDESTARRVMKATMEALLSRLKPGRSSSFDSKTNNGSTFKRRYRDLENAAETQSSVAIMGLPEQRSDLNTKHTTLFSANKNKDLKTSEDHGIFQLGEFSKGHGVPRLNQTSTELAKNENFLIRRNEISPQNRTVTKGLSVLPADVVMNVDRSHLNEYQPYCFSFVKFIVVTSCLLFLILCLLIACILLSLNIRAINRRNSISRFLLYPYN